jgi:hypothetical protein
MKIDIDGLYEYAKRMAEIYPKIGDEIMDFFYIAEMEVYDGSSEAHECELALTDIKDLITKYENKCPYSAISSSEQ